MFGVEKNLVEKFFGFEFFLKLVGLTLLGGLSLAKLGLTVILRLISVATGTGTELELN